MEPAGKFNAVRSYGDGVVRIGDQRFTRCVVVAAETLIADWPPESFDAIRETHLPALLALAPEVVLLGTAGAQRFAPGAMREWFALRKIGLETMELGAACRTYNLLAQDGRKVVAVLFPG